MLVTCSNSQQHRGLILSQKAGSKAVRTRCLELATPASEGNLRTEITIKKVEGEMLQMTTFVLNATTKKDHKSTSQLIFHVVLSSCSNDRKLVNIYFFLAKKFTHRNHTFKSCTQLYFEYLDQWFCVFAII